ncbi:nitrite/sulfite reductase [Zavarzinia compransoris]|uniref:Sulfite reductase n=1 Tax=Zavarzinia compransoris TaxID=1264899 RepID=A0A317EB28_9PROT|nr:nitrite/sulfite reductase [Zavarzinia compransoris]PWR23484.1 sulfite reductase [Zavarzinia compransoris]TDP45933.1 sulfite reductase (NADPH) hemoprotein beta-component [Zavarzinia compransoris]
MYRYDEFDQTAVDERVAQFRGQVARRLKGEITEDQFKPLRLMNGLYLQLHAYMLRVAIPYGTLSSRQLRMLAHIARKYDKGYGHFTTRQNIQYNWPRLVDTPDILADLATVEMHGIQTSGNCIRNVTSDPFAGAAADEVEDPRPWCEIIRQWSTFHPEFSYLPRKFKIAVTGAERDRAAIKLHDIGIRVVRNAAGETGFEFWIGGGMGRTPIIAKKIRDFVSKADLLDYATACLRVYNELGRRDNIYKARIKILVHEMGLDKYAAAVDEEFARIRGTVKLPETEIERIKAYFAPPAYETLPATSAGHEAKRFEDRGFRDFTRTNVHAHKQPGYAIVSVSLKANGIAPGDATAEQMEAVADIAERYSLDELRVTHEQNLVLPHVKLDDVHTVWQALKAAGLGTANIGLISDIICCPGLDYCDLANARSIPVAEEIQQRFADLERQHAIGNLKIKMSGCINACGHHHVGHIGILGVDKHGQELYQLQLGGSGAEDASLGQITGAGFPPEKIVGAIETVVATYLRLRAGDEEEFLACYRRVGMAPFKAALNEAR